MYNNSYTAWVIGRFLFIVDIENSVLVRDRYNVNQEGIILRGGYTNV